MSQSIGWCCVYLKSVKLVLISLINPKGSRGERDVEGGEGRVCMTCCLKKNPSGNTASLQDKIQNLSFKE